MGGSPYWYIVKHEDPETALDKLQKREFKAGRYNPVIPFPQFPVTPDSLAPGAEHDSIFEALEDADADGTRSILDIQGISEDPDFLHASPLDPDTLQKLYGTPHPTRAQVEENMDFLENVDRGQAVFIILYTNDKPSEIMFAGYSVD